MFYQQQLQQQQNTLENARHLLNTSCSTPSTQNQQKHGFLNKTQQQLTQQQKYLNADELEDETTKKNLTEQIEKLEKERSQYESILKASQKRIELCEKIIISNNQEPDEIEQSNDVQENDGIFFTKSTFFKCCQIFNHLADLKTFNFTGNSDNLTSLIDRIYSDNKKRVSESQSQFQKLNKYSEIDNEQQYSTNELNKMQQILPQLIQALRIRNNKRENFLNNQRSTYLEKLTLWERKVQRCEKAPKRM